MSKPKICVLVDWYLPGTKAGGPVRSVYSLVNLLKNFFDFYVLTTNVDLGMEEPYENVECDKLFLKDGVSYYYFSKEELREKNLLQVLEKIGPNLIYLNSFWSFNFSIQVVRLKKKKVITAPVLLAPRGMLGGGAMSLKPLKKRLFLMVGKFKSWYTGITFHATQAQERSDILSEFSSAQIIIAPNINSGTIINNKSKKTQNHLRLFYLSRIAKVKNLHYALEVLKTIPSEYSIEYDVFGNLEDKEYWEQCKFIIDKLPKNVTVTHKGELQFNEVQTVISNYHCLFLPTLNENFGHSIVESLLSGCPVIISDQTPWNDVDQNNAGMAIALDKPEVFSDTIVRFAKWSQEEFLETSEQANKYISNKIDLEAITEQYKKLFNDSIKNGSINV